jgi:tetratricopeptide (TPR) repeat protein
MLGTIATALLLLVLVPRLLANDYEDAWKAINAKDFKSAKVALLKATRNPATSMDAYLTLLYLQTYQGNERQIDGFLDAVSSNPDKNPYTYALWFNGSLLGPYGKKTAYQLNFLDRVLSDNSFNGSIQAAAHYLKGIHLLSSGDFSGMKKECDAMNAVVDWELAGPFENISGSGFNNNNGPITIVDKTSFKGANNVDINWFTPVAMDRHGWTSTYSHIPQSTAIVYAQAFVKAPEDMKVMLHTGSCGSIKVWINDGLVLAEAAEKQTELDYYNIYCTLKKGYNRVLVQLGYSGTTAPNFIVRFSDENASPVKMLTYSSEVQPYAKAADAKSTKSLKHFAEKFFEEKIAADPTNLINYVLLSETYLRNERTTESRQVIEKALQLSPDNPLLKFELVQCLIKSGNRTSMLQELEWLKENDPDSYVNLSIKTNDLVGEQKYDEAFQYLTKMKDLYGEDVNIMIKEINVLANQQKTEPTLQLVKEAYAKYPDNASVVLIMFQLKKEVEKNSKAAVEVLQKFLKNNYNYDVYNKLMEEYKAEGEQAKYVDMLKNLYDHFNHEAKYASYLTSYYFDKQNYQKALEYAELELKLSPFTGVHWQNLGFTQEALKKTDDAINSFRKTIYYDRTNYEVRKKLSSLEHKTELYKLLPDDDAYELIKKAPAESNYNFNYLMDEKGTIIYDEGASEQYLHYAVKIFNQKGIDSWKEINLGYNEDWQNLFVETVEVVKKNGSKVPAERDGSQVVFTGLEPGDAIHVKYRIQNYWAGRLGRELWDTFNFDGFVPSQTSKYTLIVPKDYNFNSTVQNDKLVPAVREVDGYKVYTWAIPEAKALESEPFMPPANDVGKVLHVSTLKSWNEVANWYSDLSYQDLENNYELDAAFKEIFPKGTPASNFEKARLIYSYILTNIRYSSVSFRQSAMVPQNVAKTLSTRLGDCKDVASLFVALARKAGIPAQLVLVNTRDNGTKGLVLPSMEFNHCIALAKIDGKRLLC